MGVHRKTGGWKSSVLELVLTDLNMPELCGAELVDAVRCRDASVPVVILSGQSQAEAGLEPPPGDPVAWLRKPPHLESLVRALRRVLATT